MTDVARLAGVSQMTVSRVLNGRAGVASDTRERVVAAMRELDYYPNSAARTLGSGRSRVIGVVSFDTTLFGPASTLAAIETSALDAGYQVTIASLPALDRRALGQAVHRLQAQSVEGVIVVTPHEAVVDSLASLQMDVPVVGAEAGRVGEIPIVAVDQYVGATRITQHLLDFGHETVWHIAGPREWLEAQDRLRAWEDTLAASGRRCPPPLVGDWSPRSGYEQGGALLEHDEVTAVFVANDQMALGLLRRLYEAKVSVPGNISVVGFDDVPEAAYFSPPLTTIRQDFREVGRRSLELLLNLMRNATETNQRVLVEPELVVRHSSGPSKLRSP
jgi:DNA-binding LacI/PurR family transcriptional regulator